MSRARGIKRERQVRDHLEAEGWWTCRAAGSLGDADVVALKDGETPLMVEVKSSPYAFAHFGPKDRQELIVAAQKAGAEAVLAHWAPYKELTLIYPERWPSVH